MAASPQGSLIVILKDNMKSTWQFRQFKAEATQTVRKVEHRHMHTSPPEHSTSVQCWAGLHSAMHDFTHMATASPLHTSRTLLHTGGAERHLSVHTPTSPLLTHSPSPLTHPGWCSYLLISDRPRYQHPPAGLCQLGSHQRFLPLTTLNARVETNSSGNWEIIYAVLSTQKGKK